MWQSLAMIGQGTSGSEAAIIRQINVNSTIIYVNNCRVWNIMLIIIIKACHVMCKCYNVRS